MATTASAGRYLPWQGRNRARIGRLDPSHRRADERAFHGRRHVQRGPEVRGVLPSMLRPDGERFREHRLDVVAHVSAERPRRRTLIGVGRGPRERFVLAPLESVLAGDHFAEHQRKGDHVGPGARAPKGRRELLGGGVRGRHAPEVGGVLIGVREHVRHDLRDAEVDELHHRVAAWIARDEDVARLDVLGERRRRRGRGRAPRRWG